MKQLKSKQLATCVIAIAILIFGFSAFMAVFSPSVAYAYDESSEEIYYSALGGFVNETESFSYATKDVEKLLINPTFPKYTNVGTLQNVCANVAGANLIGFYDRYYDSLIPDVTVGYERNNTYTYFPMSINSAKIQNVINDLYTRMGTNTYNSGTTQTQYKNGLASYINEKGYNVTYNSVMTNGSFDLSKATAQFNAGNPISLFMSGFNITTVEDDGSTVTLEKSLFDSTHIAIAYGYEKVTYYNSNGGVIKTEIYIRVTSGIYGVTGNYVLNKYGNLNDAEAAHVS